MLRWLAAWFGFLSLGGCLTEGPSPSGRHLFHGQNVESPAFINVGGETMVRFQNRLASATTTSGGVYDVWVTSFDGSRQRKVLANRSDRWGEQGLDRGGGRYFMANERLFMRGASGVPVGSLVRLGPTLEETLRIEGVSTFSSFSVPLAAIYPDPQPGQSCPGFPALSDGCPQLFFERPAPAGQNYPTLFLWNGENQLPIGSDSGSFQTQTMGSGNSYFILGDAHVLTRFNRPQNTLESLRANVSRFSVSGDERYVALAVADPDKFMTVVRDLLTQAEIAPARPNPSAWGGFDGATFYYSQNSAGGAPAEIHALDLTTGQDTARIVPSPLVNVANSIERPNSDERLLVDSAGQGVFTGKDDLVGRRTIHGPLFTPGFTPDGAYLIYVAPAAGTLYDPSPQGALMFLDPDKPEQEAVAVSPPGLLVSTQNGPSYRFTGGDNGPILVFWAHLGRASSDLYFADYPGGGLPTGLRVVARSIAYVSISARVLFGIINLSQQDQVGDLVCRRLDTGVDTVYAQAVADETEYAPPGADLASTWVAYIVRGRADSDRSGLWLTTLAPPPTPDGGR